MNINQEQLSIFKTVMETGSFSAAARKIGKVPSAVSMSIANMEIDLNLTLFIRQGREPVPTAQAIALYERTQNLLIEINEWRQYALSLSSGLESSLNIVVVSELLHTNWTDYIALLEKQFPELQINIYSAPQEDAQKMLTNQSAQFALMFEREQLESSEQFVELKREALVPVASVHHPLAAYDQVSFEQIHQSRQIAVASRDKSIKPELLFSKHHWRTDNHHSACSMIMQNLGWGVLPLEMFNENPELQQHLKVLNFLDFTPKFEYFVDLVWNRESELGSAARFLINHLRNLRKDAI
ncbi:LysR family transcriptional regulator [Acinetobacter chinensis]|jgi:DNA-binding transcriptional LysR family regulator|uniref:LysR family transcriptional regulator n=1 Tax=Acinetobacter chinensis TaxID=2004650 RepID=A0A3B7M1K9_9GAMM|nr:MULTISPECIES: LysR family transcriptional regulator [Acinetobacter]AXY56463.1 LysR family transcriptional regulator [Acinetobacter chinensis]AXY59852.1 LysR family transcriptional regulator [Acinetobacter sp. WCHAc010052]MDV2468135.1 LysR family transcriptional regulator [Acinetobacter chinensis]WOE42884.1 LysR family transcriptional regulator [Acinetobacter chinensis]